MEKAAINGLTRRITNRNKDTVVTNESNIYMNQELWQLQEEELAYIIGEVNHALVYLHSHHVIHRNIRGSNIFLTGEGIFSFIVISYILN